MWHGGGWKKNGAASRAWPPHPANSDDALVLDARSLLMENDELL